jgi:hypothetical protein
MEHDPRPGAQPARTPVGDVKKSAMREVGERGTGFAVTGAALSIAGGVTVAIAEATFAVVLAFLAAGIGGLLLTAGMVGVVVGPAFAALDERLDRLGR